MTIRPARCSRIDGNTALVMRITPNRLTSNSCWTWATEDSSAPPNMPRPALLTSTSMRPARSSIVFTSAATDASSVTSHASIVTSSGLPPLGLRLVPKTVKPVRARASALAFPMPEEAPVTRAILLDVEFIGVSLSVRRSGRPRSVRRREMPWPSLRMRRDTGRCRHARRRDTGRVRPRGCGASDPTSSRSRPGHCGSLACAIRRSGTRVSVIGPSPPPCPSRGRYRRSRSLRSAHRK